MKPSYPLAPKKPSFYLGLLFLLSLSLSACDVLDSLVDADKSVAEQVKGTQESFKPIADGYSLSVISQGVNGQELLFLTPEGTVRWNRSENSFERFGGKLPILSSGGPLYADTHSDLHFYDRLSSLYYLKAGDKQWQEQAFAAILPEDMQASRGVAWAVGKTGEEVAAVLKEGTKTYHFAKRQHANENFKPWFQWDQKQNDFFLGDRDAFYLQPNGNVLVTNPDKPFVIVAGTQEPKPLFDCSVLINKYCSARVFLRDNAHDQIYVVETATSKTQLYKIPENASFPVIPEALPLLEHPGKDAGVFLDAQGEVWAILNQREAETLPVAPFVRDIATLFKLQGKSWVSKKTFYPASNCCFLGPDNALYSVGFQLAAGGVYVGQPVYRLAL